MAEFSESNAESQYTPQSLQNAGRYLSGELQKHGSFEKLALNIQHEYAEEDSGSKGQLFQLRRISRFMADAMGPMDEKEHSAAINAIYAGTLVGMTTVDYMTGHANNVPQSIQRTLTERTGNVWWAMLRGKQQQLESQGEYGELVQLPSFPSTEEAYSINSNVALAVMRQAYDFSDENLSGHEDARMLLLDLLKNVPIQKVTLIQAGYWMVLKQWIAPDYRNDDITRGLIDDPNFPEHFETVDEMVETARANLQTEPGTDVELYRGGGVGDSYDFRGDYDDAYDVGDSEDDLEGVLEHTAEMLDREETEQEKALLEALGNDLAADNIEIDTEEWNRESMEEFRTSLLLETLRLKAQFAHPSTMTDEQILDMNGELFEALNAFVKQKYDFTRDDVLYAYGTFVGLANSDFDRPPLTEDEFADPMDLSFAFQNFNQEDFAVITGMNDRIVEHEVRGTFDRIVMIQAVKDRDSYTTHVEAQDQPQYERSVPAIRLVDVSLVDMHHGEAVDHLRDLIIPMTHSHQVLGRFVPPLPEHQ